MIVHFRTLWRAGIALLAGCLASAALAAGDDEILAAQDAFRANNTARLRALAESDTVLSHELGPYVEFWSISRRLDNTLAVQPEVQDFLQRQTGTVLAERLRSDWLRRLGRGREFELFEAEVPRLASPDAELQCYGFLARLRRGGDDVAREARTYWAGLNDNMPEGCTALTNWLAAAGTITDQDIWERLRRLIEAKKIAPAKSLAAYLPANQSPDPATLDRIVAAPDRYLERLPPNFSATRMGAELAMMALARLARNDIHAASARFDALDQHFSSDERLYVLGQLGWAGAMAHHPRANDWYKLAGRIPMPAEQQEWRVRAALRAGDWRGVRQALDAMSPELARDPAWVYWLARAHQAQGRKEDAARLFQSIAGQHHFYGNLADEELGRQVQVPPRAAPTTDAELAATGNLPGMRRAMALFRLGLRSEGVREWNWALRSMNDRQLLAAAHIAHRSQIWDRAINSAERTQSEHDFSLRFLAPYRDYVDPKARDVALDPAWVYGLMRQESRFITYARSGVGASGLMQLMPATARWVANKIGLRSFSPSQVNDIDTNVLLGTNYMRIVLDGLDNHPVLASAAYNAGPGRARRWRDVKPLEGAIYAETIPFNETRDYVKKVMSNAVYYSALFDGKPQSLKARLGVIYPGSSEPAAAPPEREITAAPAP